jgi:hypothetical protein
VSHPEGIYYLRFLRNGKRLWQLIGSDADAALATVQNTDKTSEMSRLGARRNRPVRLALHSNLRSLHLRFSLLPPLVSIYREA